MGGVRCWLHLVEMTWKWQKLGATRSTSAGFFPSFRWNPAPFLKSSRRKGNLVPKKARWNSTEIPKVDQNFQGIPKFTSSLYYFWTWQLMFPTCAVVIFEQIRPWKTPGKVLQNTGGVMSITNGIKVERFFLEREVETPFLGCKVEDQSYLGGGFKYVLKILSPRFLGEDSHFDWYFSKGWNHQLVMDELGGIFHCSPRLMAESFFLFETNSKFDPCNSKGKTGLPKEFEGLLQGLFCFWMCTPLRFYIAIVHAWLPNDGNPFVHWHKVWIMIKFNMGINKLGSSLSPIPYPMGIPLYTGRTF